jgi:hypothetical protein
MNNLLSRTFLNNFRKYFFNNKKSTFKFFEVRVWNFGVVKRSFSYSSFSRFAG